MVVEAVLVFVVSWWILFFIFLPLKLEMDENSQSTGCASGVPKKSYLAIKVLGAIIGAGCITCLYCYFKSAGYVDSWLDSMCAVIP
ncbi:DUF1467 family protein [Anaplasma bovis]|uniref:DUF1467 family protein n=1 Tax=Anaplasma bovis TaxID=186733 RepID=UPI002FF409E4